MGELGYILVEAEWTFEQSEGLKAIKEAQDSRNLFTVEAWGGQQYFGLLWGRAVAPKIVQTWFQFFSLVGQFSDNFGGDFPGYSHMKTESEAFCFWLEPLGGSPGPSWESSGLSRVSRGRHPVPKRRNEYFSRF